METAEPAFGVAALGSLREERSYRDGVPAGTRQGKHQLGPPAARPGEDGALPAALAQLVRDRALLR